MILRLLGKLLGWDRFANETFERFMKPQLERLVRLGVSPDDISRMGERAIDRMEYPHALPGAILREMVDAIEAGQSVDEVLATWSDDK